MKAAENGAEPTITVSISQKIGLPNYGSAEAFVSISGLKVGATEEEVNTLLDTGKLAWSVMSGRMREKVAQIREEFGCSTK